MELAPLMAFFRYDDVPGVIGRVGTLFGEAGVNIANMAVSRTSQGDKALMALSVDSSPPELVERLRAAGFDDAYFISLAPDRRGARPSGGQPSTASASRRLSVFSTTGTRAGGRGRARARIPRARAATRKRTPSSRTCW